MRIVPDLVRDVVEFDDFTVTDYHNGDILVQYGETTIRIKPDFNGMVVVTPQGHLTLEPTSVNGLPAFKTLRKIP